MLNIYLQMNLEKFVHVGFLLSMELIIRLDPAGRLTAKLWQGNITWELNLNDVDVSGFIRNYCIHDVGIKNYGMGTDVKAFHINGAANPNATTATTTANPTQAATTTASNAPTRSPTGLLYFSP